MPRVAKPKTVGLVPGPLAKKPVGGKKKTKLYSKPEPIPIGTVLVDLSKTQWKVGPSIGTGGFGEIYSACKVGEKNYDYVVKCEPHGNGPLFVEMHFYMRNAKLEDIQRFKAEHGIKKLGMPYMVGNGSRDINGQKHRFIVMPRYGDDIASFFLKNGRRLPEVTIYRLALQMIDVYEFVHSCGYVHADLKASNILLGFGKEGAGQAYLVDYGLASHFTTKEFKPDPKKMHNGTIEYTSRDAHQGVATRRADMEILGYNLIEWSGVQLPWVRDNLLLEPAKVQQAKEAFMADVSSSLKRLFAQGVPIPIAEFMKYVAAMKFDETPDYVRCRKIFSSALKSLKCANSGDLVFQEKGTANNNVAPAVAGNSKQQSKVNKKPGPVEVSPSTDAEEIEPSDDDDDVFEHKKPSRAAVATKRKNKTAHMRHSPTKRLAQKYSPSPPRKRIAKVISKVKSSSPSSSSSSSPLKRTHATIRSPKNKHVSVAAQPKATKSTSSPSHCKTRSTPISATPDIKQMSPSVSTTVNSGKTVINDQLTPKPKAGKTYEFNFELDVSMDANVVVNVKRKEKPLNAKTSSGTSTSSRVHKRDERSEESPAASTRVKVRKLHRTTDKSPSAKKPK